MSDEIFKLRAEIQRKETEPEPPSGKAISRGGMISKMNKLTMVCKTLLLLLFSLFTPVPITRQEKQRLDDKVNALSQEKSQLADELEMKDLHLRQMSEEHCQQVEYYQEKQSQLEAELERSRQIEEELGRMKCDLEARWGNTCCCQ